MPKLSIIVPVYNVEEFLDKCMESILAQTYTDYELILVDDGSPDHCGEMCDNWAKRDHRIRVIHKENGGLSDARNAGIDVAQGHYIGFVDSDDYIREDMFEVMVRNLEEHSADISMCGYEDVYENGQTLGRRRCDDRTVYVWSRKEAIYEILLGRKLSVHAVTKLYKSSLFKTIRYPKGKISEDAYIIMDIMSQVNKAVFTPRTEYYYFHRGDSIKTAKYKEIDNTRIEAHKKNYEFIKMQYPEYTNLAFERYLGAIYFVVHKMVMSDYNNTETEKLISVLRQNMKKIIHGKYFKKRRIALITVLISNIRLYKMIICKLSL